MAGTTDLSKEKMNDKSTNVQPARVAAESSNTSTSEENSTDSEDEVTAQNASSRVIFRAQGRTSAPEPLRGMRASVRALECLHCPYATHTVRRFQRHLESHGAVKVEYRHKEPTRQSIVQCPFCTYRTPTRIRLFKHIDMHFDFKRYLKLRGLAVRYERHWAEGDTIQMGAGN